MTITNSQKWFFGGVVASLIVYLVTGDSDFAGFVFVCSAFAAMMAD